MTGFGTATVRSGPWSWTVEVRSLNQRGLEVRFNMPRELYPLEAELRALVQHHAARGKVDVNVSRTGRGEAVLQVEANEALARAYVASWRRLQQTLELAGELRIELLTNRAELFTVKESKVPPQEEQRRVRQALQAALRAWNKEREREGKALAADLSRRFAALEQYRREIAKRVKRILPQLVARLRERVRELLRGRDIDEQRLLQEAVLIAERSDVTEELVRLATHLKAARALLKQAGPVGKRLEFLLQELQREFNTIAAKSADPEVTALTVDARSELEKIREQVQNLE
ncbi:MAG: YicC family protein [Candidatus Binatia bacterium]|nr:YicC family protein [Candidatus Binatia bacterium]